MDADDAAPCPQCGVSLYPQSWAQTWAAALALIDAAVAFVLAAVWVLNRR